LEELRAAKESLHSAPQEAAETVHIPTDPVPKASESQHSVTQHWNPWVYTLGIAAGVLGIYMYICPWRHQSLLVPATKTRAQKTDPVPGSHQLKPSHDPFYME